MPGYYSYGIPGYPDLPSRIFRIALPPDVDGDDVEVEYFEIVDDTSLQSIEKWEDSDSRIACITVQVGKVRLLDNLSL